MFIRSGPTIVASFWPVSEKHTHFSSGINQVQCRLSVLLSLQVLLYLSLKPTRVSIHKAEHEGHICDSTGASVTSLLPSICQSFCRFLFMTSRERPVPLQTRPTQNNIHQPCTLAAFENLFLVVTHCFMKFVESKFVGHITVGSNLCCIIYRRQAYTPIWALLSWHSLSSNLSWHFSDLRQTPQGKSWLQYSTIQPENKLTTGIQCTNLLT